VELPNSLSNDWGVTSITLAEKPQSTQADHAREVWTVKGKRAFEADRESEKNTVSQAQHDPK
jgi:hypothetical protein